MRRSFQYDSVTDLPLIKPERVVTLLRSHMDDGFTRREVSHHLTVVDPSFMTIKSRHTYVLVADRQSRFFQRRYSWTGSGDETPPVVSSGIDQMGHRNHKLQGPVVSEKDNGRLLVVDLGRTLAKGDSETVVIEHSFVDTGQTFKPYMGHLAYTGCKKISIAVSVPKNLSVTAEFEVRKGSSDHSSAREVLEGLPEQDDLLELVRFEKVISKPVPGEHYAIVWTAK